MPDPLPPPFTPDLALLAELLDHVPARVALLDRGLHYRYVNKATLTFMGLAPGQIIGRTIAQVRGEATQRAVEPIAQRVFDGEEVHWEGWAHYPGRGDCYVEEILRPYRGPDGRVDLIIRYARDLTAQKRQAQQLMDQLQALQRAEMLKAAIVDNALAAIVSTDGEGRVVEFNPAAEAMFGVPRCEAVGQLVSDLMIPERHRAAHQAGMARVIHGGPARVLGRRVEMDATRADGSEFPIEMVLWRTDVNGRAHFTASIQDVSDRARAAEVIERQREALRQNEKLTAMGSLLAGVAHELNNPLSIVMGRANLLEDKAAGTSLHDDAVQIRTAAERCGRIVRTFLNMARQRPAQRTALQFNDLVRGAAELLQYSLRVSGIELALQLCDTLPEIQADADRLGQAVLNLVVNAQQALGGSTGARQLVLETGMDVQGRHLWMRVRDNGPGVPAALRERIFDPYFTTKGEGVGTGLGLSVSRSVAREHGGELVLEEREPGASFRLELPLQTAPLVADAAADAADPADARAAQRLLVIDDEPEIVDLVRTMLEGAGYDVATAESGAVALEMLAELPFDAVVSDLRMPDMDGAALWREVGARWPALARRMLFVTGDTLSAGAREFLAGTGCPSLDKPFSKADLLARVHQLLAA